MSDTTIEVDGLHKRFGQTVALDGVSFTVAPGTVTGFVGPNGAGKSTTMRIILGLDCAERGAARVAGRPYTTLTHPMRLVGSLLDAGALQPSRSGRNHLLWIARSQRLPSSRVDEVIELVGLGRAARRKAGGYSLGMCQRLGIAAAMLGDPPMLIMDEPFNGMDPEGIIWIRSFLRELAAEGRAVLVSSHLLSELPDVADHVVVIGRGRVLADGTIEQLTAGAVSLEDAYLRLTTGEVEYRSGADPGDAAMTAPAASLRDGGFRDAVRAEWTKFRTVRGWLIGLVLAVLLVVLFTYLQAHGKHTGYCTTPNPSSCVLGHQYVPNGPGGEAVADAYELVFRRLTGDGTLTARVGSFSGRIWAGPTDEAPSLADTRAGVTGWSKAGLLVTPSTRQGAAYAAVMATGGHGVRFQYDYTHDRPGLPGSISGAAGRWLRLTRRGDTITGYDSANRSTWRRIGSARLTGLPRTVDVGLFVTSPTTSAGSASQATARFDDIAIGPGTGSAAAVGWRGASIGTGPRDFYPALGHPGYRREGGSIAVTGSGDIAPAVGQTGGDTASDSLLFGLVVALIVLIVIGSMFITSEYRRGLIRTTLAATPDRGRALAAKAVVLGGVAFVAGVIASAVAIPLGEHVTRSGGNYIFPADPLTVARVIAGSGALIALTAIAVLGIGTIVRRSPGAILIGVVVFVLPAFAGPGVLAGGAGSASAPTWLYTLTPAAGFSVLGLLPRSSLVSFPYTMSNGYYPLSPGAGLLVLCGWAAAALAAATIVLRRRDA